MILKTPLGFEIENVNENEAKHIKFIAPLLDLVLALTYYDDYMDNELAKKISEYVDKYTCNIPDTRRIIIHAPNSIIPLCFENLEELKQFITELLKLVYDIDIAITYTSQSHKKS